MQQAAKADTSSRVGMNVQSRWQERPVELPRMSCRLREWIEMLSYQFQDLCFGGGRKNVVKVVKDEVEGVEGREVGM